MSSAPASVHSTAEATVLSGKERKDSQEETEGDVWNEQEHSAEMHHSACEGGQELPFSGHREMKGHGQRVLRFSSKI